MARGDEHHPLSDVRASRADNTTMDVVVFELGTQRYGLPVDLVREVVPLPMLLELAGATAGLCGLLNRRGIYIPVINGRLLVGLPPHASLDSHVVLAGGTIPEVGLLVDRVTTVEHLATRQSTELDRGAFGAFLDCVISTAEGPIMVLHFPALIAMTPVLKRATQL